jgi:hypothetical protein
MIYNLQAQSGSCRHSMWCGAAEHTGMPSPTEQDQWGACTFFGGVPIGRALYGVSSASKCELITRLHLAAVIEGRPGDILARSDLSRSSTLSGSVSTRPVQPSPSNSDVFGGRRDGRCMSILDSRKPHAEKVSAHRPRQNKPAVRREYPDDVGACQQWHSAGADGQGTLTITGSNVHRGTEMPVALSLFDIRKTNFVTPRK